MRYGIGRDYTIVPHPDPHVPFWLQFPNFFTFHVLASSAVHGTKCQKFHPQCTAWEVGGGGEIGSIKN
jgi:hypothetical protein